MEIADCRLEMEIADRRLVCLRSGRGRFVRFGKWAWPVVCFGKWAWPFGVGVAPWSRFLSPTEFRHV